MFEVAMLTALSGLVVWTMAAPAVAKKTAGPGNPSHNRRRR